MDDTNQTIVFGGSNGEMQRYTVAEAMYLDGNINAAILYHYINGYCKHAKRDDGFVYLTADKIYSETAINKRKQDTAFKLLEQKELLVKKRMYISGTTKSCLHFKTVDKVVVFANSQINKTSNCTNQQNVELYTNQQNVELFNISDHQSNRSSNHTYASSADATLAGADKKEPMQVQSAVDVDSSLSTSKNIYSGHSAKTQKTSSILQQVIDIINPSQKITDTRLRALNARLKEYSVDEVLAAAKRFAKDEWRNRPENKKFKSVDYLLMPSKFSRWAEMADEGANEKPKSKSISIKY